MNHNKKQITLRLKEDLFQRISNEAENIGISVNAYITMILSKGLCKEN